jgi:hypothetical protein
MICRPCVAEGTARRNVQRTFATRHYDNLTRTVALSSDQRWSRAAPGPGLRGRRALTRSRPPARILGCVETASDSIAGRRAKYPSPSFLLVGSFPRVNKPYEWQRHRVPLIGDCRATKGGSVLISEPEALVVHASCALPTVRPVQAGSPHHNGVRSGDYPKGGNGVIRLIRDPFGQWSFPRKRESTWKRSSNSATE